MISVYFMTLFDLSKNESVTLVNQIDNNFESDRLITNISNIPSCMFQDYCNSSVLSVKSSNRNQLQRSKMSSIGHELLISTS